MPYIISIIIFLSIILFYYLISIIILLSNTPVLINISEIKMFF